jgi:hypothetical protein
MFIRKDMPMDRYNQRKIVVADGGRDGLLPGRYLARCNDFDPSLYGHGATPEDAVAMLKRLFARHHPGCEWAQHLPWVAQTGPGGVIFHERD